MGTVVLATTVEAEYPEMRAYTHCQAGTTAGGLTILLINLSNSTVSVDVNLRSAISTENRKKSKLIPHKSKEGMTSIRHEYHLSALSGDLHSQTSVLNGVPLELTPSGNLPSLDIPVVKENSAAVSVKAHSIVFVVLPDAQIPLCMAQPR
jgi:heparanase 1